MTAWSAKYFLVAIPALGFINKVATSDRRLDRKYSEQNIGAPPSYEEAVSNSRSPVHSERYLFLTIGI